MADARTVVISGLRQYRLCKHCLQRQGSRQKAASPCYVCRGLFERKDEIVRRMVSLAGGYEFRTFLVGATLPTQIYEREDALRARLKIRGKESAKSQLTREIGMAFAKAAGKRVDYLAPDLVLNVAVDKESGVDISAKSKAVAFEGRYTKKAPGLAQKQERCKSCQGGGCPSCGNSGLAGFESVEGLLAREIMALTGGRTPRFSWVGSEDRTSLVLGSGRPFYVRVSDPHRRTLSRKTIRAGKVVAVLAPASTLSGEPLRFTTKTKIRARCEKPLGPDGMRKLRSLAGAELSFDSKSGLSRKRIHSATPRRVDAQEFTLTIVADGGLPIKQFVGGQEFMSPNVSETLGASCDCLTFDILDVTVERAKPAGRFQ